MSQSQIKSQSKVHPFDQNQEQTQMNLNKEEPTVNEKDPAIKVKRKMVQQNLILYWGCLISILLISYLNVPIFMVSDLTILTILTIVVLVVSYVSFIANCCIVARHKGDLCKLFFLLDPIFVALCTAIIGFVGILTIMLPDQPQVYPLAALMAFNLFLFATNSRVILAYCKYKRWQVIIFKMTLLLGLFAYLVLAAYFMKNSFTQIPIPKGNEQSLKEFFFLYIFGLFTLYMQIFAKASDLDGTADLQYHYQMHPDEEIEVDLEENEVINEDSELKGKTGVRNVHDPAIVQ